MNAICGIIKYNIVKSLTYTARCMTSKCPFCMLDFSSRKIINHYFHVNNDRGKSGIDYDMIICCDMMVQIGLTSKFKHKVLQWDGATVHMKNPAVC